MEIPEIRISNTRTTTITRKNDTYSYLYGPLPHCENEKRLGNGSMSSGGSVENVFISSELQ